MEEREIDWARPVLCRSCGCPTGQGVEVCLACGTPLKLLSKAGLSRLLSYSVSGLIHASLITVGLFICYKVSPLVLLFPLLCVFSRES